MSGRSGRPGPSGVSATSGSSGASGGERKKQARHNPRGRGLFRFLLSGAFRFVLVFRMRMFMALGAPHLNIVGYP